MSPRRLAATRRMQHRRKAERARWLAFARTLRETPFTEIGLLQGDTLILSEWHDPAEREGVGDG